MLIHPLITRTLLGAMLVASLGLGAVWADDDHEKARRALEAGEVMSLRTVLDQVERDYPGQVIEVELDREDGRWVYEIKLIRAGGGVLELELDARDGTVLKLKGRDVRPR